MHGTTDDIRLTDEIPDSWKTFRFLVIRGKSLWKRRVHAVGAKERDDDENWLGAHDPPVLLDFSCLSEPGRQQR